MGIPDPVRHAPTEPTEAEEQTHARIQQRCKDSSDADDGLTPRAPNPKEALPSNQREHAFPAEEPGAGLSRTSQSRGGPRPDPQRAEGRSAGAPVLIPLCRGQGAGGWGGGGVPLSLQGP